LLAKEMAVRGILPTVTAVCGFGAPFGRSMMMIPQLNGEPRSPSTWTIHPGCLKVSKEFINALNSLRIILAQSIEVLSHLIWRNKSKCS